MTDLAETIEICDTGGAEMIAHQQACAAEGKPVQISHEIAVTTSLDQIETRIDNLAVDDLADVSATAPTLGMILIYNAAADAWQANTITAGSNITIANANGAITVSVTGLGAMAFQNTGATGSFTAASGETITAVDGVITSIV